eukprot:CAMPEP_0206464224 /NCGR_PEP_ID=MMETSP0324_2-20121206/27087_1 /ASSEMBLY_ACC=CAM_ASM_000836 /TAXON_ID=2866 /ORGANISM="Crypthecodinium cohnii, Strain Seligo" /LENGTH=126 /DNA_ID=CAMNT_0053936811 /DNA_START=1472 /DNA_END=1852 /DNA_ORIENTATION=-
MLGTARPITLPVLIFVIVVLTIFVIVLLVMVDVVSGGRISPSAGPHELLPRTPAASPRPSPHRTPSRRVAGPAAAAAAAREGLQLGGSGRLPVPLPHIFGFYSHRKTSVWLQAASSSLRRTWSQSL